jgi:hypothetical protein
MFISLFNKVCIEQKTKIISAEPFEDAHGTQGLGNTGLYNNNNNNSNNIIKTKTIRTPSIIYRQTIAVTTLQ